MNNLIEVPLQVFAPRPVRLAFRERDHLSRLGAEPLAAAEVLAEPRTDL